MLVLVLVLVGSEREESCFAMTVWIRLLLLRHGAEGPSGDQANQTLIKGTYCPSHLLVRLGRKSKDGEHVRY